MGCKRLVPPCACAVVRRLMRRPLHTDEGGSGYTSGDPSKTRWANWATAYVKYCDGGSMTGTKEDSTPQRNGSSGPLWCKLACLLEVCLAGLLTQEGAAQTAASTTSTRSWSTWSRRTPSRPSTASSSPAAPPAAWCAPTRRCVCLPARTDQRLLCREDLTFSTRVGLGRCAGVLHPLRLRARLLRPDRRQVHLRRRHLPRC